jgi:AAA+ ATPase superfamily predicted ATPase
VTEFFVGRRHDLRKLDDHLDGVTRSGRGRLLAIQGRRQVGKSTLLTEFLRRHPEVPSLFFTASRQATVRDDLARFTADVARESTLPGAGTLDGVAVDSWEAALRLVAAALPEAGPSVVVLDELPWLLENDPGLEGTLQKLWDTVLERRHAVLVVLVGSDLSMMEALVGHRRPLFGRVTTMVVRPFDPADTAAMLGASASVAEAFDAYLVTGGYPRLLADLAGRRLTTWLRNQLADDTSPLLVTGERILAGEFPDQAQARRVLGAAGAGERTFATLAHAVGIRQASLQRALQTLADKRVVVREQPLAPGAPDAPRYRVADHYLRFWLRFCRPALADVSRGRGDLALDRWRDGWSSYRGRAIEPVIREALARLATDDTRLGGAGAVGGWWNRTNRPEVDVVGVDRADRPGRVAFTGTIKWRGTAPLGDREVAEHRAAVAAVPALTGAPVVAIAAGRVTAGQVDAAYTAADLLAAW